MAFRAVLILDPNVNEKGKSVVFKRSFAGIEKQFKHYVGEDGYRKIPTNITQLLIDAIKLKTNQNTKVTELYLDDVTIETPPVYDILHVKTSPIVAFYKFGLIFSCVMYDESLATAQSIISGAHVLAYSMLENMATYLGTNNSIEEFQCKLLDLHKYVMVGLPYGVPIELNINTVLQMTSTVQVNSIVPKVKSPAWRPVSHKGKQLLNLSIVESVSALLFDKEDIENTCEIYGSITCKADVEESPEIIVQLIGPIESGTLNQMVYHPCVQVVDDIAPVMKRAGNDNKIYEMESGSRKIRFCPPPQEFSLCHYKAKIDLDELPIHCFYQMKGDEQSLFILIQIKLNKKMKNTFEKFEVFIPFFNRGPISSINVVQQSNNVVTYNNRAGLIWNLGNKIASKTNDACLEATIKFDATKSSVLIDDQLVHLNSYVMLNWRMTGFTYSSLMCDQKLVELYPNSKVKINSVMEFKTVEYKVWNSHGDIPNVTYVTRD